MLSVYFPESQIRQKGAYILIRSNCPATENYVTELCTQSEGGTDYIRVYFQAHLIWNLCQSTSMRHFSTVMNLWRNTHRIAIIEGEKSKTAFASCVP